LRFNENELFGAALIGFDIIEGPFLKWKRAYQDSQDNINIDDFAMNFYLAFRGGNGGKKPRAILYDDFYIVAFPKNLELCCLFMKPHGIDNNIKELNRIAYRLIDEMDPTEEKVEEDSVESSEDTIKEVERLIVNLLNGTEMSTPELRKYFKLSNSQIWKLMSDLESANKIKRTEKKGRAIYWTAA
jgi:biotin operon repressor